MTLLRMWRLFGVPIRRMPMRTLTSPVNETIQQPHVYSRTYTEDELIMHFIDNTVYESKDYVVTSIPQGVFFSRTKDDRWKDSDNPIVCDKALQEMIPKLCETYKLNFIFVAKHPRRTASGMLILAKNFKSFSYLRKELNEAVQNCRRIYTYLALVMGCPTQTLLKTFKIEQGGAHGSLYTEILEDGNSTGCRTRITKFEHTVIDSLDDMSLLKVTVSYDLRDCVRHILAQKCFTPVFGDFWNISRTVNFLFGAPIKNTDAMKSEPYKMTPSLLQRLHLSEDQQKIIPIHLHLYGMKLPLQNKKELFVSVPPTESFIWTCSQLGLHKINLFTKSSKNS